MLPTVISVLCTRDRVRCVERVLKNYIDQDYSGDLILWIYNNSPVPIQLNLPELPENRRIILSNSPVHSETKLPYSNVGILYNDVLSQLSAFSEEQNIDPKIITWTEDDDLYLPIHISEGVKGMQRAWYNRQSAYKPYYSYYRDTRGVHKMHNVMEPSIFIDYHYMLRSKFRDTSMDYHFGWLQPLIDDKQILVDNSGIPTLIYDWGNEIPVYKLSGSGDNSIVNFDKYKEFSKDRKETLTPISEEKAQYYYNLIKDVKCE